MNAEEIFHQALARPPNQRPAFLIAACAGDQPLQQRIEALLHAHDNPGSFLAQQPPMPAMTVDAPASERPGTMIGLYKLLQQIGEGGMGVVFMAEQLQPVRRMVALKVIKAGMDTAQVIARFEAERQALALMDHPNIAKVLDANKTPSGRPYFVMELVKGVPITRYCDEQRLSPRQRLELFVSVCQAIQHAHQKGIIHRDIKPSNVLIAAYDGKPVSKVIDFGVAKATGAKLTERTLFTGFGGLIGTLEYMSPEQAEFNALDIDTRSDIYSLGVLLYELLTGTTPLTRQQLKDAALLDVLRLIREEEPPKPSTRLSESKDSLASVSAQRHMEPAGLLKTMRGEVDWIVMKALEKDRSRRYDTANGLARDIQRYLAEEPVEAGPPSATYRLRRLAWKHRRSLATAVAFLLLLIAGVVVSTSLAVWAMRVEKQARVAAQEAVDERNHALDAEAEAKRAEENTKAVLEFFQDKFLSAGRPEGQEGGLGTEVKLIDAVNQAQKKIGASFTDRPLVEASIRDTLGATYQYLGDYPQAIQQHERAVALREAKLGPDHPDTLNSRNNLASAYWFAGRTAETIRLLEPTLKQLEAKLGPEHRYTLRSRNNLANAYHAAGRAAEAIPLHEQNLKQYEAKLGPEHPDTLTSANNLAAAYHAAGRTADAIRLYEQNLKEYEAKLGPEHPVMLQSRNNLANAYRDSGRTADAIRMYEQNLKRREAKFGPKHPRTLHSRGNLALAYLDAGRTVEAIRLLEPTLRQQEAKLGLEHPYTLGTRGDLAYAYHAAGRTAEANQLDERILKSLTAALERDLEDTTPRWQRGDWYARKGRWQQAADDYTQVLQHKPPTDALQWLHAAPTLAASDPDAYRRFRRTLLQRFATTQDPPTAERIAKACLLLPDTGADIEEACQLAERAVALGKDHAFNLSFVFCKGLADYRRNNPRAAIATLEPLVPAFASDPRFAALNQLVLALALHRQGDAQAASKHLAEGAKLLKQRIVNFPDFNLAAYQYSHDWAIAWLLHCEAQRLLAEKKAGPKK